MSDEQIEQQILDSKPTAPRVTQEDVKKAIVAETYTLLPSGRCMVCELTLFEENGFTVRGESAVVNIENFREDIGKRISRENAVNKVWEILGFKLYLEGFAERNKPETATPGFHQRLIDEQAELQERLTKLGAFLGDESKQVHTGEEQLALLKAQHTTMLELNRILNRRLELLG